MNPSPLPDDSLRDLLRSGDPYRGDDMPPGVATRIRQRTRDAATTTRLGGWQRSMVAVAGVLVTAAAIWLARTPARMPTPAGGGSSAEASATARPAPDLSAAGPVAAEALATEQARADASAVAPRAGAPRDGGTAHTVPSGAAVADSGSERPPLDIAAQPATLASNRTAARARSIRFTAPRGTRIIWSVNPDLPETTNRPAPAPRLEPGANSR